MRWSRLWSAPALALYAIAAVVVAVATFGHDVFVARRDGALTVVSHTLRLTSDVEYKVVFADGQAGETGKTPTPAIDVVLRNDGSTAALITEIELELVQAWPLVCWAGGEGVTITAEYDVKVPTADVPDAFSHRMTLGSPFQIAAKSVDRLAVTLGPDSLFAPWLYDYNLVLVGDDGSRIDAGAGLALSPIPNGNDWHLVLSDWIVHSGARAIGCVDRAEGYLAAARNRGADIGPTVADFEELGRTLRLCPVDAEMVTTYAGVECREASDRARRFIAAARSSERSVDPTRKTFTWTDGAWTCETFTRLADMGPDLAWGSCTTEDHRALAVTAPE